MARFVVGSFGATTLPCVNLVYESQPIGRNCVIALSESQRRISVAVCVSARERANNRCSRLNSTRPSVRSKPIEAN